MKSLCLLTSIVPREYIFSSQVADIHMTSTYEWYHYCTLGLAVRHQVHACFGLCASVDVLVEHYKGVEHA